MGGSSGSPVLDSTGRVIGQLSGACGFNLDDVCDSRANATVDGALFAYYPEVEPYLDPPAPPCPDNDNDGHTDADCGGTDCDDGNSRLKCRSPRRRWRQRQTRRCPVGKHPLSLGQEAPYAFWPPG